MQLRAYATLAALAAASYFSPTLCGQVRDAGDVVIRADVDVIPVRIEAGSAELQRVAASAFNAHGAFRVQEKAAQVIQFAVSGTNTVTVSIKSGTPARDLFSQPATGSSLRNALFRAADAAVARLTGAPGFFAGRLAFVSERTGASEIYTSDLFFGEVLQITNDRSQAVMPRWSPDGQKIIYTGYFRSGFPDIYVIDTTSLQRNIFVSVKGTNTGARFSPDGSRVAMILSGEGNPEVYVSTAQGRGIRRLTTTKNNIEATPTWSREGDRLIVASDGLATGKPQLYMLSVSGGGLQRLPTNISGYCAEPDWSHGNPDMIAFTAATGSTFQIATFSLSSREAKFVSKGANDGIEPCWLNDGRHLVYTSRAAGAQRIMLLDTKTGRVTPLSSTESGKTFQANFILR